MSFLRKPLCTDLVFLSGFFFTVLLLPSFAWSAPQISIQTPSPNETIDGKDVFLLRVFLIHYISRYFRNLLLMNSDVK